MRGIRNTVILAAVFAAGVIVTRSFADYSDRKGQTPAVTSTQDATHSTTTGTVRRWKVIRILDGDTFEVDTKFFPPELGTIKVRAGGIDTPESGYRAQCDYERNLAVEAKQLATNTLLNKTVVITDIQADKYGGRVVAVVTIDGKHYNETMIAAGLARPYSGGTKQSWCN